MNKMKYQAGGAVDSTDEISPKKLKKLMQQQKDAEMDANMQKGAENQNRQRVGGKAAAEKAAAKKGAAKKAAAKPKSMNMDSRVTDNWSKLVRHPRTGKLVEQKDLDSDNKKFGQSMSENRGSSKAAKRAEEGMNMGGMVGYKKGGKVEKKKAGGMVGYKEGGKVRGCGIATQGVRKASGDYS